MVVGGFGCDELVLYGKRKLAGRDSTFLESGPGCNIVRTTAAHQATSTEHSHQFSIKIKFLRRAGQELIRTLES